MQACPPPLLLLRDHETLVWLVLHRETKGGGKENKKTVCMQRSFWLEAEPSQAPETDRDEAEQAGNISSHTICSPPLVAAWKGEAGRGGSGLGREESPTCGPVLALGP